MKPVIAGNGTTHWYECVCGEPISPYQSTCPSCGQVVDWQDDKEQAKEQKRVS